MPVVAFRGDEIMPLGTCFAISNHGLVLTARHVIDELKKLNGKAVPEEGDWWIGALYVAEPTAQEQIIKNHLFGGLLIANKIHSTESTDIAAIHLNLPRNISTNEFIHVPAFRLSPGVPLNNSLCFGVGYHSMEWNKIKKISNGFEISQKYSGSKGVVQEIHMPYRDKTNLTYPCFQTSSRFDGGMSGGPVFNESGGVIGVICSSFDNPNQGEYISYVSMIAVSLLLNISAKGDDGEEKKVFLYDFYTGGAIGLDHTIKNIEVTRENENLSILMIKPNDPHKYIYTNKLW